VSITLSEILDLVGKLDDTPGEDTGRERFRRYLGKNLLAPGSVRDYIEECLRNTGEQYNRALQDLVNCVGKFLGFDVTFGRYQGVRGQIGFDGDWRSPTGFHLVVEVKTTEIYAVKTATLVDYVNQLISEKEIPSWEQALGLYVVGRPDPEIRQLENAIIAEKRSDHLRIISVNSLLSLAEMMNEYDIRHDDILAIIRPLGCTIDPVVVLMTRLVAEAPEKLPTPPPIQDEPPSDRHEGAYWLTPVASDDEQMAEEVIQTLVGDSGIYAFGERTPGRGKLKPRDWMCFYANGKGVVAHARISSMPEKKPHQKVRHSDKYPWVFRLMQAVLYLDNPVVIDFETRTRLEAFKGRDPNKSWAWFVQGTHAITEYDFQLLTRQDKESSRVKI
jgi:hypothetical protein